MTTNQPPEPKKPEEQQNEPDPSSVVDPIKIARARHASTHQQSVVEKRKPVPLARENDSPTWAVPRPSLSQSSTSASAPSTDKADTTSKDSETKPGGIHIDNVNGCLLLAALAVAFSIGGLLGGLAGGGIILWANDGQTVALSEPSVTPTVPSTPTPMPAATTTSTPTPEPTPTPAPEDIIDAVIPSVVTVINQQNNGLATNSDDGRVVGSGIVVDVRGYIATNYHVIENPGQLRIILSSGLETTAELVAFEPADDLALIKVSAQDLIPIQWGDSTSVRPGQRVYAIGSPLGDFPNSVSLGIVSGLNRALEMDEFVIDGLLQTDTAINRGSSGGPLINEHGELIGINTFIIRESEDRGIAEGIAFAIPSETAKELLVPWIAAHGGETIPIPASE